MFGNSNAEKPPIEEENGIELQALGRPPQAEDHNTLVNRESEALEARDSHGNTALMRAVLSRQETVVKQLLEAKADINTRDHVGLTPLMRTVVRGYVAIMTELLNRKPDLEVRGERVRGRTALMMASAWEPVATVKQLLEAKADINTHDNGGMTPLMAAVTRMKGEREGCVAILAELLNRKPELLEERDNHGNTALMHAVFSGQEVAVVEQLLEAKADINTHDNDNMTPLMVAAESGYVAILAELLQRKPDLEIQDRHGDTALTHAVLSRQEATVKQLLEAKANINTRDHTGLTPLMWTVVRGYVAILTELLERKPDLELRGEMVRGRTALMMASAWEPVATVKQLLEAKADINTHDNGGMTPLMAAATREEREGCVAIMAELLNRKPELLEERDSDGNTALMHAVFSGQEVAVVEQLLEAKADINTCNNEGKTAFTRTVEPLVGHCLKKDAKLETKEGKVKSDKVSNYWQILKLLIKKGADTVTLSPLTEKVASVTILNEAKQQVSLAEAIQAERDKYTELQTLASTNQRTLKHG